MTGLADDHGFEIYIEVCAGWDSRPWTLNHAYAGYGSSCTYTVTHAHGDGCY